MVKKIFTALAGLLLTFNAHSSFLIEPSIGYILSGDLERRSTKADYSGLTYGARLGFDYLGFMGGVEYSLASYEYEYTAPEDEKGTTQDIDASHLGVFLGYNLPVMFRVWGTYYFQNTSELGGGSSNGDELSGSGLGLGLGYTGLPFLSLNLEYKKYSYDEYEDISDGTTETLSEEFETSEIIFSVSFPINI